MEAVTLHNQNILDIAIQEYGTVQGALGLAMHNGIDLTDDLMTGQHLNLVNSKNADSDVVRYYLSRGHKPATAAPLLLIDEETDYFPALPGMLSLMLS